MNDDQRRREVRRILERSIAKGNSPNVEITDSQRRELETLWFIYGNRGRKHTDPNHRFIQGILERGRDERDFYDATEECVSAVDRILNEVPDE